MDFDPRGRPPAIEVTVSVGLQLTQALTKKVNELPFRDRLIVFSRAASVITSPSNMVPPGPISF